MAIRELGGALALPEADLERLTAVGRVVVGAGGGGGAGPAPRRGSKLASPRWRALAVLAREAAGLPRHLSQHSGAWW